MAEAEQLISEIKQIREQYVNEVGKGRRVWPRSIVDRICELSDMGLKLKVIAAQTDVPYETICQWRYKRSQRLKKFHDLTVTVPAKALPGKVDPSATVTVAEKARNATVTVTTPDGFLIEGLPADMIIEVMKCFSKNGA